MTPAQQRAWIKNCRPQDLLAMDAAFEAWAEAGQIPPSSEGWRVWLMMAGRGYGKTRAGAEWIHQLAMTGDKRIALVGATIDEARGIMVEGVSGLIGIARRKRVKIKWEPGLKRLTWPRGSVAELFSGDSPEGLRGPEHDFAWCACHHRLVGQRFNRRPSDCSAACGPFARHPVPRRVDRSDRSIRWAGGNACRL
jgi:phage terminase large subunit-like protein